MVRRVRRLAAVALGGVAAVLLSLTVAEPAKAAPKPPAGVDITGHGLAEPLRLRADSHPAHVSALLEQVDFRELVRQSAKPKAATLGPKYTIVVLAGDVPKQTYDLYPGAAGGPRIHRPAKQPEGRKTTAAWFLGRINMSETLRTAGVPLERTIEALSGGTGGGERIIPEEALNPARDINEAFGDLRRLLLLNVAVMVVITLGLAGIALLIRRRTR
ncbi:hypothetical protein [Micromonospora endophytica]|uniref:Uncharacterized protein n=1 Tax=Micromonospora endophytica TaxID=515350 RepID=A0A2W2D2H1_9ACTN|nr:hypothetical protein [Micromonospora endophytica]PZF91476.1 hypothetical protein C1I93_21585 [Micromonospora endophytica]RIW47028.1 hypothetical protein D3H59_10505 [Micromonospora endophytica]BCJ60954.1 hypothetical protein Jiend_43760 [Micromonospora endophytica]